MIKEAIILAGGLGKRMGDSDRPKWLIPIADTTIAQYQVKWLSRQGIKGVYVTMNRHFFPFVPQYFTSYPRPQLDLSPEIIWEDKLSGDEGSLKGALDYLEGDDALVINCDILTDLDLSLLPPAPALVVVHPRAPWGVLSELVHGDNMTIRYPDWALEEKPTLPIWVSSGIYYFPKSIRDELVDNGMLAENIIPKLLKEGRLNIYKYEGLWHAIETPKDVEEASRILNERDLP